MYKRQGNGKLLVQLSKNLNGINTVKNGNTTITLNDAPGGATNTPAVTISGGNLSVDGNKVTNVDDGTNDSDAVNLKQLKAAKTEVKAGENVTVKHTTDATDNHNIYTVSAVTPAVYTKADGTKVYKIVDPTSGAVTVSYTHLDVYKRQLFVYNVRSNKPLSSARLSAYNIISRNCSNRFQPGYVLYDT